MEKPIKKILLITILLLSQLQTADAISLGRVIYDTETPDLISSDEPSWEEQLNEPDESQAKDLSSTANEAILAESAVEEKEPPQTNDSTAKEEPAKVITVVKHVYEPLPKDDENDRSDSKSTNKSTELSVSTIKDTVQPVVDQLSAKVTNLEAKVEETGTTLQNIILIVLVVILCLLTLRTEVRFQKLADKYDKLRKQAK